MAERLKELDRIQGVFTMAHRAMVDERGRFTEIFRQEWRLVLIPTVTAKSGLPTYFVQNRPFGDPGIV